jgi:uncharacterized protein (TIGR03083 family)
MSARQHLIAERRALLALCRGLGPAEWEAPSWCEGWRVRDVVAHMVGTEHDAGNLLAARGDVEQANARSVQARHDVPVLQLVTELAELAEAMGLARWFAPALLVDNWIHQEDIRRPLGRPRAHHDPWRLGWVLRVTRLAPYSRARDLRLVATDLDLVVGRGPEVWGPAADLILAAAGRTQAAHTLDGPGAARLAG